MYAPETRATIETVIAAVLGAGVITLAGLFRRTRRQRELLLFAGLLTLGMVDLVSNVAPADLGLRASPWSTSASPIAAALAAGCFVVAAYSPSGKTLGGALPWGRATGMAVVVGVMAAEGLGLLIGSAWRQADNPLAHHPDPVSLVPVVIASALLMAVAGCRMARTSSGPEAIMLRWFGIGALLLATGLIDRLHVGPAARGEITDAVLLRLLAYMVIGVGLLKEVLLRQRRAATVIAQMEQRRLARALHDGLCQDLAFIAAQEERLGDGSPLAIAARRALAASRGALAELAPPLDRGLDDALRALAAELSARFEISVEVEADLERVLSQADRDDLVHIAHEAIVNAVKHGGAQHVKVLASDESGQFVMTVQDDGAGIASADRRRDGFGMANMRERAASLGGVLTEDARTEGGTELRVSF